MPREENGVQIWDPNEPLDEGLEPFKVQRALHTTAGIAKGFAQILIYNRSRTFVSETMIGPKAIASIFGDSYAPKVFVTGKILEGSQFYMHERIAEDEWPNW